MHRVVRSLALVSVLVHMVCGCCSHHAHAQSPDCCRQSAHAPDLCLGAEHDEHGPEPCSDERAECVFVVPKSGAAAGLSVFATVQPTVTAGSLCRAVFSEADVRRHGPRRIGLGPPVRAHLLNQVLLL